VVTGLRRKRAHLAGEIEMVERAVAKKRAALANLDAAIKLFDTKGDPTLIRAISPRRRGKWFGNSEQTRFALAALRASGTAMTVRQVMELSLKTKGLEVDDAATRAMFDRQTREVLMRLTRRGVVFRFEGKPVTWSLTPVRAGG
jgi:hypothetical protein